MVGGIFYEHTHRLIASTVGLLIIVLAGWLRRAEPRRWVRRLGYLALAAVVTQGLLGGITVLWLLPDPVSIAHAGLAQIVFCLLVTITVVTSRNWRTPVPHDDRRLQAVAVLATAGVFGQILLGATMRHRGAGLAIPDFPLVFGGLVPPVWDPQIALHYGHRVGAVVAGTLVVAAAAHALYHHRAHADLRRPALLLLALLPLQIGLGGLTVMSRLHYIINSLHVAGGAMVLAASLVLTLRAYRSRIVAATDAQAVEPAPALRLAGGVRA
jgi:cytochrome c oxidase assembly protein subunit 15